jgi:hypothetical protein
MRRWFELGFTGDSIVIPSYNFWDSQLWYEESERWGGRGAPQFVHMPYKDELFAVIAALSYSCFQEVALRHSLMTIQPTDDYVQPAEDCLADHLPDGYTLGGFGEGVNIMPNLYQQLIAGFTVCDWAGNIVGATEPIFDFENSPQTDF